MASFVSDGLAVFIPTKVGRDRDPKILVLVDPWDDLIEKLVFMYPRLALSCD